MLDSPATRVLVVEDEDVLSEVVRDFLTELGHQPVVDLSATGMKVRTGAALAVGTAVKCGFAPPDGGDVVDVIALVVRRDADVTAFSFANLPAHEQRRLDALVRRLGR